MIAVAGGGAFGTALAVALALDGKSVTLWARDPIAVKTMQDTPAPARHHPACPEHCYQ